MTNFTIIHDYASARYDYTKLALRLDSRQSDIDESKLCLDSIQALCLSMGITLSQLDNEYNDYLDMMIGIIANDRRMIARKQAK